jgi:hypothetical protein
MPTVDAFTLIFRPCRMTTERTPRAPRAALRKRNTVPSAFIDHPAAGAARRAHSPVSGLLISMNPPWIVGSSVPPGSGATTGACTTSTSLALSFPWRSVSECPAIVSSMPSARPARRASASSTAPRRAWATLVTEANGLPPAGAVRCSGHGAAARGFYNRSRAGALARPARGV